MNPVRIYNEAGSRVPAYRDFLIKKPGDVPSLVHDQGGK
jgi:hypothetical protein